MSARAVARDWLLRIVQPVFETASQGSLRSSLPPQRQERAAFAHAEAFCRSFAGAAPWLVSPGADERRDALRAAVVAGLAELTNPRSADFMRAEDGPQMLVEAAFLSSGLLRAGEGFWSALPDGTQSGVIAFLETTRRHEAPNSNWLLFPAMVEAFLRPAGARWEPARVEVALLRHEEWYLGDGCYGDGPQLQVDYYNSYVIQPFLHEVITALPETSESHPEQGKLIVRRLGRYAQILERLVCPQGTFPALGRSLTYRTGAFHALAYAAWKGLLPRELTSAAVRGALAAVADRSLGAPGTFDEAGWLRIGLCGFQPGLAEHYINSGSLYLSACGFLTLGLPAEDEFWASADADWTSRRLWRGEDAPADKSLADDDRRDPDLDQQRR